MHSNYYRQRDVVTPSYSSEESSNGEIGSEL